MGRPVGDEIADWLLGLEGALERLIRSEVPASASERREMVAKRGVYEGVLDDMRRKWPALFAPAAAGPIRLLFIINGEDVIEAATPEEPLIVAMWRALVRSRNVGRPITDWQLWRENGTPIDSMATAGSVEGHVLVTLAVGFGGAPKGSAP